MQPAEKPLSRVQIRTILKRHRGSQSEAARAAGVHKVNVYKWLKGGYTSANVENTVRSRALELLKQEQEEQVNATVAQASL